MWAEQSENDHKKTDMKNIMEKIGLDKFAHFFAGATIAYTVGNLMALQVGADGWGFAVLALAGLVCAAVAGLSRSCLTASQTGMTCWQRCWAGSCPCWQTPLAHCFACFRAVDKTRTAPFNFLVI